MHRPPRTGHSSRALLVKGGRAWAQIEELQISRLAEEQRRGWRSSSFEERSGRGEDE